VQQNDKRREAHYVHRITYSAQQRLVGLLVIATVAILVFTVFSLKPMQNLFEKHFDIHGIVSSARGISEDAVVVISGIEVGNVTKLDINERNEIIVTMRILDRYHRLLREDSRATIGALNVAGIGKSVIDISIGSSDSPLLTSGARLEIVQAFSAEDFLADVNVTLKSVARTMSEISATLPEIAQSARDISHITSGFDPEKMRKVLENMDTVSGEMRKLVAHVSEGKGVAGLMLSDESMRASVAQSVVNLQKTSETMTEMATGLQDDLQELPDLLQQFSLLMDEADRTNRAVQRIWPLSTAVPSPGDKATVVDPLSPVH
jgi:ABC-type transporter Mla subunit MlaD